MPTSFHEVSSGQSLDVKCPPGVLASPTNVALVSDATPTTFARIAYTSGKHTGIVGVASQFSPQFSLVNALSASGHFTISVQSSAPVTVCVTVKHEGDGAAPVATIKGTATSTSTTSASTSASTSATEAAKIEKKVETNQENKKVETKKVEAKKNEIKKEKKAQPTQAAQPQRAETNGSVASTVTTPSTKPMADEEDDESITARKQRLGDLKRKRDETGDEASQSEPHGEGDSEGNEKKAKKPKVEKSEEEKEAAREKRREKARLKAQAKEGGETGKPEDEEKQSFERVTLPGGVLYQDQRLGKGRTIVSGDEVSIRYQGMLSSGEIFDSNMPNGKPLTFTRGGNTVIPGLDLGMKDMCVGGKRRIVIPPTFGYGSTGVPGRIPPNSHLIFDIELLNAIRRAE